jgi:hypothetical protein
MALLWFPAPKLPRSDKKTVFTQDTQRKGGTGESPSIIDIIQHTHKNVYFLNVSNFSLKAKNFLKKKLAKDDPRIVLEVAEGSPCTRWTHKCKEPRFIKKP